MDEQTLIVYVEPDVEDLIPGYIQNRHHDVEKLQGLLQQGDFEAIRIVGHRIRGSAISYGFERLSQMGKQLESAARAKESGEIERLTSDIRSYLACIKIVVQ